MVQNYSQSPSIVQFQSPITTPIFSDSERSTRAFPGIRDFKYESTIAKQRIKNRGAVAKLFEWIGVHQSDSDRLLPTNLQSGNDSINNLPYGFVTIRGSRQTTVPWSVRERISRPKPCLNLMTASGNW